MLPVRQEVFPMKRSEHFKSRYESLSSAIFFLRFWRLGLTLPLWFVSWILPTDYWRCNVPAWSHRITPQQFLWGVKKNFNSYQELAKTATLTIPIATNSIHWFCLILVDSVLHMHSPVNWAWFHVYQIHQTPDSEMCAYSQAMDALHLPLYQFHQSPTTGWQFCARRLILLDLGEVSSRNGQTGFQLNNLIQKGKFSVLKLRHWNFDLPVSWAASAIK